MQQAAWGPGHVIDDKYRLVSKLGEGGMGSVWRADHLTLNAPVAIKLVEASIANTEEGVARFMREAQAAAALRSAHVVQTFDYGVHEGVPFIVMELLEGESLADRLERAGRLPPSQVASILKQVARAVGKAHEAGIVHRDLKPDNIFLVAGDDDEEVAKVLDFGIAKSTSSLGGKTTGSKTRTGALLGTPYYMSPEQAQGIKQVDYRTDLWALGVIVYESLLGTRPFESEALGDLLLQICTAPIPVPSEQGEVPSGFDEWFARAAARDTGKRFGTAKEMAKAFAALIHPGAHAESHPGTHGSMVGAITGVPIGAKGSRPGTLQGAEVARPQGSGSRSVIIAAVAIAGLAATGAGVFVLSSASKKDATEPVERPSVTAAAATPAPKPVEPAPAGAPSDVKKVEAELVPEPSAAAPAPVGQPAPAAPAIPVARSARPRVPRSTAKPASTASTSKPAAKEPVDLLNMRR